MSDSVPSTPAASAAKAPSEGEPRPARRRRELSSEELFGGSRTIGIRHADEVYTLRQTSRGKLILTK
jgi:hemin uptake protein HemP